LTRAPAITDRPSARAPRLHYLGQRPLLVRGGVSGRTYRFNAQARAQAIDPRDVIGLLQTKLFRQG
jgi:hypothetical protein